MNGLTTEQVKKSRAEHGSNVLTQKKRKGFFRSMLSSLGDPIIKVLLIALGINIIFLFRHANWFESFGIALAIIIAVVVSTLSEMGSEQAFKKLQAHAQSINVRVRRNGQTVLLSITELVVGDVVLLGAGDKIPADGIIIKGNIEVDQSTLNGESKEAKKYVCNSEPSEETFLSPSKLFSGTVVTAGEGVMQITQVGDKTFYGNLATEVQDNPPDSPLKIKLEKLAKKISSYGYIGAFLVAVAYLVNAFVLQGSSLTQFSSIFGHLLNAATLAVSIIVMAVPEGLPMMITVVLSSNMKRMMKDNVLVRKLNGIETAGSMNILFTDKTGTLTTGKQEVVEVIKMQEVTDEMVALNLVYNNSAEMLNGKAIGGNATDRCLLEYAMSLQVRTSAVAIRSRIPFTSQNKFMSTTLSNGLVLTKGAAEVIIDSGNEIWKTINSLSERAIRVIALASDGKLIAIVGIRDQIREQAAAGVKQVQSAGIQTVMITGDSALTAVAIAKETGILQGGELVLTSDQMAKMSDVELAKKLPQLRVVARALPSDKSRLVRIAQSLNLVVGMTGDGVNDAPALKKADVGFAMGSGTEVAKEAGDVVILDDNIQSISRAVSYGRTVFKNIRKFIIFQLSINFCAMAVSIIAPFLNISTPITVIQMLWINLVMDTLAGLAFGGERPRASYMKEPPKRRDEQIITKYMWQQIIVTSIYTALISLWFLKSDIIQDLFMYEGTLYAMTAFFTLFMFTAIFNSLNARTSEVNLLDCLSLNKTFIWIMGVIAAVQIVLIYFGGTVFRTTALDPLHLLLILIVAFTVIPVDMLRKKIMQRHNINSGI